MKKEFTSPRSTDWKANANKRRTRSLGGQTIAQIFEIHDDKSMAAHLVSITRSKGVVVGTKDEEHRVQIEINGEIVERVVTIRVPVYRDFYYLKDEEVLKIMESYREELDVDALESAQIAKKDGLTD